MAGIFVRGLTGNKVSIFVDGQRYSTGSARGGVNTFLDLIGPDDLEAVEVLRGPSSAQYGSDALGGTVQFLTRTPPPGRGNPSSTALYAAGGNSADGASAAACSTTTGTSIGVLGAVSRAGASTR